MTTAHTNPPAPTVDPKPTTDTRPSWPNWYSVAVGALLAIIGFAAGMTMTPYVFVILTAAAILVIWGLQRIGARKNIEVLKNVPAEEAWKPALWVAIIGIIMSLLGTLTGTIFLGVLVWMSQTTGILNVLIVTTVLVLATIGLLFAVSHRAPRGFLVCLIAFALTVMVITQAGTAAIMTPFERTQDACNEAPSLFPADCN